MMFKLDELLSELVKLETQNADLLSALKVLYNMVDEQYGQGIANGYWPTVAPRLEQAKQAITAAERNQELTQLSEWEAENLP